MAFYKIPMMAGPQRFQVKLVGVVYQFTALFRNAEEGGWFLDIADEGGVPLVQGIALVTGLDLLHQYSYLGIAGELYAATDGDLLADPSYSMLGTTTFLYFWTEV